MGKWIRGAAGLGAVALSFFGCTEDSGDGGTAPPGATCGAGEVLCGATCAVPATDPLNCGACGVVCGPAQACSGGVCQCQAGLTNCGAGCVDLGSSATNCGACGTVCAAGTVCSSGQCAASCAAGQVACGQDCVVMENNPLHCGGCNAACGAGQVCAGATCVCEGEGRLACGGVCVDAARDNLNCGSCGTVCGAGTLCQAGTCAPPSSGTGGSAGTGGAGPTGGAATGGASTGGAATGGAATGGATTGGAAPGGPPPLHVEGNRILDPHGNTVVLRGVSLIDIGAQHQWEDGGSLEDQIDRVSNPGDNAGGIDGWHAKIVRLPVYPPLVETYESPRPFPFDGGNDAYYDEVLKPAVDYATAKGLYVIVDFHQIGDSDTHEQQARDFWTYMAPKFADQDNVFYEVFNEPIDDFTTDPVARWTAYRPRAQGWVDIIRQSAPDKVLFVGAPIWSQNIGPAATAPITGGNIVYVAHVYPFNWNSWFQGQIEQCHAVHPVILTEWGYWDEDSGSSFKTDTKSFVDANGLSFTAWVVSKDWGPPLFTASWTLRDFGAFTKQWLYEKRNADQPQP